MCEFTFCGARFQSTIVVVAALSIITSCSGDRQPTDPGVSEPDENPVVGINTPEVRDDSYWAELAQSYPAFVPEPGLGAAIPPEEYIVLGRWSELIDWPEIATGAANLPDGRLMTWSSTYKTGFGSPNAFTFGSIFDPATGLFTESNNDYHNTFCSGVSMLPDGSTIAAGGGATIRTSSIFDELTESWSLDEDMNFPRWYPTVTTLPTGQVLTSLGTTAQPYSELWSESLGWDVRTDISLQSVLNDDTAGTWERNWYPTLNVAPNGSLFHSGPTSELFSLDLSAGHGHGFESHGKRENGNPHRLYGTSVMYDIGKMLIAGGGMPSLSSAMSIDLNSGSPLTTPTNSMNYPRAMQNSVVLPDGKVLIIGGNSSGIQFSDEGTQMIPEMWDPDTGFWQLLAPQGAPRNYHSTALLLKDGRVAAMGGGLCGNCLTNHKSGEIFDPPYLFNPDGTEAVRPVISSAVANASAGDSMTLTGSSDMVEFNMVRLVALTHHHTTDQRLVPLTIENSNNGTYQLGIPGNVNVVIPGNYWIFGMNDQGVPSVGHTINIAVTSPADTFSVPEKEYIAFEYFEGNWSNLPDFDTLTPVATGTLDGFLLLPASRQENFAFRYATKLRVPFDGQYTFYTKSDDGTELTINGQTVVENDGLHGLRERNGSIILKAGDYDVVVTYFDDSGGQALEVTWSGPDFERQDLSTGLIESDSTPASAANEVSNSVSYEYYEGLWNTLPDFSTLVPVTTGKLDDFELSPAQRTEAFAFRFSATIQASQTGEYTFYTSSDDGSQVHVDGSLVVDNDGIHPSTAVSGTITLDAGTHDIVVTYFERWGNESLAVEWSGPGFFRQGLGNGLVGESIVADTNFVNYEYYEGNWNTLPELDTLSPVATGTIDNFYLTPAQRENLFAIRYTTLIDVPEDGDYTFFTSSDDGSQLWVDGLLVVDNDGLHPRREIPGTINLTSGTHDLVVTVFEKWGAQSLEVKWSGPSFVKQDLSNGLIAPLAPVVGATSITYEYFEGLWNTLPEFDNVTPLATGSVDNFDLTSALRDDRFAFRFSATLTVANSGDYTFFTASDDGSQLFVNEQLIVDNDGIHPYKEAQGTVSLTPGDYPMVVTYFEKWGGQTLDVFWSGPGFNKINLVDTSDVNTAEPLSLLD